ncbi:MAG: hypothetical protein JXQ73_16115 [Phycisphaerae bacterium]|nr:hypothetical protein [Phycisphaerae bacterium]
MARLNVHYRNPDFAGAIAAHRLDDAETVFGWQSDEWIGARLYGSLLRDTVDGIGPVYIKRYDYNRAILQYRLIGSRAYREWANSVRLARLGLPQPETITVATRLDGFGVSGSFLITREVPAAVSLEALLGDTDDPPDDRLLERLADGLTAMIRRMHDGGLCHWDLKLRNVIVSRPNNDLILIPIDAVNGRSIRPWNRRHAVRRDYRFLLSHPRLGPLIAARQLAARNQQ